jgi:hypothetical protein
VTPSQAALRRARRLLLAAAAAQAQSDQRLFLAAGLREVMERSPVVVGGAAEAYWASEEYHPTDLDMCPRPTLQDERTLATLGFRREGRHWVRDDIAVGVEFPGSGDDIENTVDVHVDGGVAVMISCEDLYLDRLRQTTATERRDVHFDSAVAVAAVQRAGIDWPYVERRIRRIAVDEPHVGEAMQRMHPRVRATARRLLAKRRARQLEARPPD